ncbi:hypothetical protein [Silvanigrella sp.]|jgi:hypothetical protein|uniref:hypothetical protein n=1 Tax=Silvanigrella sp. TaxID=2024976 RepID=UPI0037CB24AF
MKHFVFLIAIISLILNSCAVGFSNKQRYIPEEFSKVYIPSAKDSSIYSGNSSRLSQSVRQKMALRTDIQMTDLENARWALQIKILDRKQSIVAIEDCKNPSTASVASGAFKCSLIHPELNNSSTTSPTSFNQPTKSPSQEKISLVVQVKAIDLNSGATMWAKQYAANNIPEVVFNEIGDTDGNTLKYMQWTPDLHVFRYQEAINNAVKSFSEAISSDIQTMIFESMPKKGTVEKK